MNLFTVCLIQAILHLKISLFITLFSLSSFSHLFGFFYNHFNFESRSCNGFLSLYSFILLHIYFEATI